MSTIKQKTAVVDIDGGKRIEVRRMRWKAMRDFLKQLGITVSAIYANAPADQSATSLIFAKLPAIIAGSDDLINIICTQSTGLSLDEFGDLDALSASAVLARALEINCDEEIKNFWAGIAVSVAGLLPTPKTTT